MKAKTTWATLLTLWVAVVAAVGVADGFSTDGEIPWPVLLAVAVPLAGFAALYGLSRSLRNAVLALDPRMVLGIQLWRVVGAAFLFGWAAGDLPAGFAVPAGVGDIATGIAAAVSLAALLRGSLTRVGLWAFTALGVGDFLTAIVTGAVLAQPERINEMPWVLFPALAIPFFAILHFVSLKQLTADRLRRYGVASKPADTATPQHKAAVAGAPGAA